MTFVKILRETRRKISARITPIYKIEKNHPFVDKNILMDNIDDILATFKNKFEEEYQDSIEFYEYKIDIADVEVTGN